MQQQYVAFLREELRFLYLPVCLDICSDSLGEAVIQGDLEHFCQKFCHPNVDNQDMFYCCFLRQILYIEVMKYD